MPAYRSEAEGEIRGAVVDHLRAIRPDARIIHEINVAGQGSNRIDVLAVSRAEIIAVEIKSAKDKLDRLKDQMAAMRGVAHYSFAAIHERFLVEKVTNKWAAHYERDGVFYRGELPDGLRHGRAWLYPKRDRTMMVDGYDCDATWRSPNLDLDRALPSGALDMLWRDELFELCGSLRVLCGKRATMTDMTRALRWLCNGKELTQGICAALRARRCVEADPEIGVVAA